MKFARSDTALAALLVFLVVGMILATRPLVEAPRNDDFSYARSAEALAQTGRIVYNGWGSPILLPQLALGALVIKIFGFSYHVLDVLSIVIAALAALAMFALARAGGCSRITAALATAALTLNPVFLSLAPSFMSDIPSLLLLLLALLALVRSLQPERDGEPCDLVRLDGKRFAASVMLGVLAGSNRQVSWAAYGGALLALLALLPRTERPRVLGGIAVTLLCGAALTRWFNHQPYTVPLDVTPGFLMLVGYTNIAAMFIYKILNMMGLFLLPLAIPALATRRSAWSGRRWALLAGLSALCLVPVFSPLGTRFDLLNGDYGLSESGKYFTARGVVVGGMHGLYTQPKILPDGAGQMLTLLGAAGLALTITLLIIEWKEIRRIRAERATGAGAPAWTAEQIAVTALALSSLTQLALSAPYWAMSHISDRHLLLYLPGLLIALGARASAGKPTVPALGLATMLLAGMTFLGFGFAASYMNYTRAQATLYHQLIQQGVSPREIDGGFEFNADTQVRLGGHINNETMVPKSAYDPNAKARFVQPLPEHFPVLDARYVLSLEPYPALDFGLDPVPVATTTFDFLFPPRRRTMYVLRVLR